MLSARDGAGRPVTPAGAEVERLIGRIPVRVGFLPTRGSGITPWRRAIVLDTEYRGAGQATRPARVALVAHELVHILQREIGDTEFWPSGGFRPSFSRRWIGDSTNTMEVHAYIVGASVEIDLTESAAQADWLATLTDDDALNATRAVVKRFDTNPIYRQNYRVESRSAGHRIPPKDWAHWLAALGFEPAAIDHIRAQAAAGQPKTIDQSEIESLVGS